MKDKIELGESRYFASKSKAIANFENRGETFQALEQISAALMSPSLQSKNGFKISAGDTINVIDKKAKEMQFVVFRIIAGMPILVEPTKHNHELGLLDRLHFAWEVFTGKFFKR